MKSLKSGPMKQPTLRELLRRAEKDSTGERVGYCFLLTGTEHALLKETAYRQRISQAEVFRIGLRLVAEAAAKEGE